MKLNQIEAFVALAESGSIGNAAARLGLSQPAVTRQLQQLEAAMGVTLLDRRTKPPTLTANGQRALSHCRRLLNARSDLLNTVNEDANPVGTFRLGVAFGAADFVLQHPIDTLRLAYPELKVEVLTNWSNLLMKQTLAGTIDAAVVLTAKDRTPLAELEQQNLHADDLVVVANKGAQINGTVPLQILGDFDWVLNPEGCWYRDLLKGQMMRRNIPLKVSIETFGIEFQLSLVSRGVGLGLIPHWAVCSSAYKDQIKTISIAECRFQLIAWSVRNSHIGQFSNVVDTLENAVKGSLQP